MKRITMIASLWMLWCLTVISCSGGKKADAPQENQPTPEVPATIDVPDTVMNNETQTKGNPLNDKDVTQLVKYKDKSRNCVYYVYSSDEKILYKYDLDTEKITAIHLEESAIKYANGESPLVYGVDQFGVHGNYIFIVANNGGSGMSFGQYLIAYNTLNDTFSEITFASHIRLLKGNRQAKVELDKGTKTINLP